MRQDDGDTELLGGQLRSFYASEIREVSSNRYRYLESALLVAFARFYRQVKWHVFNERY